MAVDLRGCALHFDGGTVEQWVELHLHDVLLPFWLEHRPGAKGAIIVNSVAQAEAASGLKPNWSRMGSPSAKTPASPAVRSVVNPITATC